MVKNAYSELHPKFLKVVRTINTSETYQQLNACHRLIDNFLKYIQDEEEIGVFPKGINREVLATYYGQELHRVILHQTQVCSSIK